MIFMNKIVFPMIFFFFFFHIYYVYLLFNVYPLNLSYLFIYICKIFDVNLSISNSMSWSFLILVLYRIDSFTIKLYCLYQILTFVCFLYGTFVIGILSTSMCNCRYFRLKFSSIFLLFPYKILLLSFSINSFILLVYVPYR